MKVFLGAALLAASAIGSAQPVEEAVKALTKKQQEQKAAQQKAVPKVAAKPASQGEEEACRDKQGPALRSCIAAYRVRTHK